jgi:hypothetical protein|tara:strand:+ start:3092 stop:3241 length:150 start_codon:yes stop_codon:yes gene_type:complete
MVERAFCMRCKQDVNVSNGKIVVMGNGRKRLSGICDIEGCEAKLSKIIA